MNPRPLTDREQHLIDRYAYCQLGMTPQTFYAKWHVSQEAIAAICSRPLLPCAAGFVAVAAIVVPPRSTCVTWRLWTFCWNTLSKCPKT